MHCNAKNEKENKTIKTLSIITVIWILILLAIFLFPSTEKDRNESDINVLKYKNNWLAENQHGMLINKNDNYTTITTPIYLSDISIASINDPWLLNTVAIILILTIAFAIVIAIIWDMVSDRWYKKPLVKIICTIIISVSIAYLLTLTDNDSRLLSKVVEEYTSINSEELKEFTSLVEGSNNIKQQTDLIEIVMSKGILKEENSFKYRGEALSIEDLQFGNERNWALLKWKTNTIPVKEYFDYIKSYAENSGGEYIEKDDYKEEMYMYKTKEFKTEEEAINYIDNQGLSADEYREISKSNKTIKNIIIKVPKTAVATTETKLNELLLKYILEKEEYKNVQYANDGRRLN